MQYTDWVETSWHQVWWLFRRSVTLAYEDGCFGTAKGAAYSALLCFFPLLTATTAILIQARAELVSRILSRALSQVLPPGTEGPVLETFRVGGQRPVMLLVVATFISVWAASRVMTSLMEGFHAAYNIPTGRPFLRHQGVAILLVLSTALPIVLALGLVLFGTRAEQLVLRWLGVVEAGKEVQAGVVLIAKAARYAVALAASMGVAVVLYFLGPSPAPRWQRSCGLDPHCTLAGISATSPATTFYMAASARRSRCWCGCTCWRRSRSSAVNSMPNTSG